MQTAERLAQYLARELDLGERKADSLRFGAEVVFSTVLGLVFIATAGYLSGCLPEALAAAGACALVRSFAGGAHCSTVWRCAVVSAAVFPSLGRTAGAIPFHPGGWELHGVILAFSGVSVYLILKLAPVDSPSNPIREPIRRRLKRRSLTAALVVILALLWLPSSQTPQSIILAAGLGLLWSALILTSPLHKLMDLADRIMGFLPERLRKSASQSV